ncbi:MAG: hypothetical protein K6E11_00815 [Bacilli bacterium]|nr:hypothetical protein [Bacilli bacterium]
MYTRSLKDYLKSLKFYFTPLGVMSIFCLIGFVVFIKGTTTAISDLFSDVGKIVGETSIQFKWGEIWQTIWGAIKAVDWSGGIIAGIKSMLNKDWLTSTLYAALGDVFGDLKDVVDQVMSAISICVGKIATYFVTALVLNLVGIVVGYIILSFLVRRELTQITIGKLLLLSFIDLGVVASTFIIANLMGKLWGPLGFIFFLIGIVGGEVFSVLEAFWFFGRGKVTLKELIKPKNVGFLLLGDLTVIAIGIVLFVILFFVVNPIIAIYLGVPLVELTTIVIGLTGETYVLEAIGYDKDEWKKEHKKLKKAKKASKKAEKIEKKALKHKEA